MHTYTGRRPIRGDARAAAALNRPAIAVAGTTDQLIEELQQVLDETGARRLLVELFSAGERRMFASEVMSSAL